MSQDIGQVHTVQIRKTLFRMTLHYYAEDQELWWSQKSERSHSTVVVSFFSALKTIVHLWRVSSSFNASAAFF